MAPGGEGKRGREIVGEANYVDDVVNGGWVKNPRRSFLNYAAEVGGGGGCGVGIDAKPGGDVEGEDFVREGGIPGL